MMSSPASDVIKESVEKIMMAMSQGVFAKEDLESIKKVFQAGIQATDECLARGPSIEGDVDDNDQ